MDVRILEIGPVEAEHYLRLNTSNRKLRKHYVLHLAGIMARDEFVENGDSIRFNGEKLIDGQHRLSAIVESKKRYKFVVVSKLSDDAFSTIDKGLHRKTWDTLKLEGFKNCKSLSASVGVVVGYSLNRRTFSLAKRESMTDSEVASWLRNNSTLCDYVSYFSSKSNVTLMRGIATPSLASALTFITSEGVGVEQSDYWKSTFTGIGLREMTGSFHLYQRLRNDSLSFSKMPTWMKLYLSIKAWKKDFEGVTVKNLSLGSNESLPRVKGFDAKFGSLSISNQ